LTGVVGRIAGCERFHKIGRKNENSSFLGRDDRGDSLSFSAAAYAEGEKPNILLIVANDVGWGDLGAYGGGLERGIPTPNLDKIAGGGMTFPRYRE
jgi:hypothetical protein